MNRWLAYDEFYELQGGTNDWHPPFYVTVTSWLHLSPLDWYNNLGGYTVYLGTDELNSGPDWLESDHSYANVCFPDYWNKFLAMKAWYIAQYTAQSGMVLVDKRYETNYSLLSGYPMDYGSPYYPMGPYEHNFIYRRGLLIR